MHTCIIVEDNPVARESLRLFVQRHAGLEYTDAYEDALTAADAIEKCPPDILFVDVELPGLSGLEMIKRLSKRPFVIFTTASREYAADAFEENAVDYLVKPISWERFCKAVDKVLKQGTAAVKDDSTAATHTLLLKDGRQFVQIPAADIYRAEARGDYVKLYTPNKSFTVHSSIKAVEERLHPLGFRRVHRSHLVRLSAIRSLSNKGVKVDEIELPVSDTYIDELRKELGHISLKV